MKRLTCSFLCFALAGTLLAGCSLPGLENGADSDNDNSMIDSYSTDTDTTHNKQEYSWLMKPTVTADNIISFDGSQVDPDDEFTTDYANYSVICRDGKYGLIDYSGNVIVEPEYDDYYTCWCGETTLYNTIDEKNNIYEYCSIDSSNQVVNYALRHNDNAPEYFWDAKKEKVFVKNKNEQYATEYTGKKTVVVGEATVKDMGNDNYEITPVEGTLYGLAKKGLLITALEYQDYYAPSYKGSGLTAIALQNSEGKWGYVSSSGKTIVDFICDADASAYNGQLLDDQEKNHPYLFSDKYVPIIENGSYGYYDMNGECVVPIGEFEQARPVHNGRAWVRKNGMWGVIQLGEISQDSSVPTVTSQQTENYTQQNNWTDNNTYQQQTTEAQPTDTVTQAQQTETTTQQQTSNSTAGTKEIQVSPSDTAPPETTQPPETQPEQSETNNQEQIDE